jgi:hypothetical protein
LKRATAPALALVALAVLPALALAGVGCGPGAAAPGSQTAIANVHRAKCGACHTRVEPGTRTRAQLEAALSRHRKRVRLTEAEWAEMIDYLAAR